MVSILGKKKLISNFILFTSLKKYIQKITNKIKLLCNTNKHTIIIMNQRAYINRCGQSKVRKLANRDGNGAGRPPPNPAPFI